MLFAKLLEFVTFDIIPDVANNYAEIFDLEDISFNANFEALDYGSQYFLSNFGTAALFILAHFLYAVLSAIILCCCGKR